MKYYQDPNGDFITVAEGSIKKTYAFFRIDKNKPQHRGSRVKTRPMRFFPSMEEGFSALKDYAGKRQWQFVGTELPAAKLHQTPQQRGTAPTLFAWIDHQNREPDKPKTISGTVAISDAEYETFKTELVRQAIIVAQTDMKDWKKPDPHRAIQVAMTNLQQSKMWPTEIFSGLNKRILNDTGEMVGSKYQIKNMLGGVFQKIETKLASMAHQISSQCPSNQ